MARKKKSGTKKKAREPRAADRPGTGRTLAQRCYFRFWFPTVLVTVALFVLLEGVLALLGMQPANRYEDPFVGFSATHPLFVPSGSGSAMMETAENKLRFFNYQSFPRDKGDNTYRIFCVGGSTTFGRPYDDKTSYSAWLRELLPVADPSREWEVINAGGISYASYRIALLVEELSNYEPDLFVIYTGHNEFLEERTYRHLSEGPGVMDSLRGMLGNTRVYSLARTMRGAESSQTMKAPENVLTPEVVTRLEKSVGPADYSRDSLFVDEVVAHYKFNLDRMITIAEERGAQVMLVTPASNLRHSSPFKSEHRASLELEERTSWEGHFERAQEAVAGEAWDAAMSALEQCIAIDEQHAESFYIRGRIHYEQESFAAAQSDFERARDLDVCPLRALGALVGAVREIAAKRNVPLVDYVAVVQELAENSIPGNEQFLDHVHPTNEGHQEIGRRLLDALRAPLGISLPEAWDTAEVPAIGERIYARLDTADKALALRNLSQVLGWAGKFEEARDAALKSIALAPEDTEAHYLVAWNAQSLNDGDLAEKHYRRILAINPEHPLASFKLAQVLEATGNPSESLDFFRDAVKHRPADPQRRIQLASALLGSGDIAGAKEHYAAALKMAPEELEGHVGLGNVALREGKLAEARHHYGKALSGGVEVYGVLYGMGEIEGRERNMDRAAEFYRRAIAADPQRPQPHLRLAWFAMRHPDPARRDSAAAVTHAERALELSGGADPMALNTLALAHAATGDTPRAIHTAKEALRNLGENGAPQLRDAIQKAIQKWEQGAQ